MAPRIRLAAPICALALCSCQGMTAYNPNPIDTADADADADADTDSDADADTDSDTDTDADVDTDADPLTIRGVDPAWGSNGGGTNVTIEGTDFDDSARVYFIGGQTKEASVLSVTGNSLVATVPASPDEGFVDVRVTTDTRAGTATSAFQYWIDGTGDDGAVGGIEWYHYVGSYWGTTPTDFGNAFMFFTAPTTERYRTLFYSAALDQCESNYAGANFDPIDPDIGQIRVTTPTGGTLQLVSSTYDGDGDGDPDSPWYFSYDDTDGNGYADDLRASEYSQNGTYGLRAITADGFPSFDLSSLAVTPAGQFTVSNPALSGSTVPTLGSSIRMQWTGATNASGSDPDTYMVASLLRFNNAGTSVVETVTCTMRDDGDFTVPSSVWTAYPSGVQVTIVVGRITSQGGTLPYNNANSGVTGAYFVIGAGFTQ